MPEIRDYPKRKAKKLWLSYAELGEFVSHAEKKQVVPLKLLAYTGCRVSECAALTEESKQEANNIWTLKILDSKPGAHGSSRVCPLPTELIHADFDTIPKKRTIQRYVSDTAERYAEAKQNPELCHISAHTCRRSLGTALYNEFEVTPEVICHWLGFTYQTFADHYALFDSAQNLNQQRGKVPFYTIAQ